MKNPRKISDVTEVYWINVKRICGPLYAGLLWAEHVKLVWAEHALRQSAQCYHLKNALKEKK